MSWMKGKAAFVSGGGSGLGAVTCGMLAQRGVNVVVADVNFKGASGVASEINKKDGGRAIAVDCNVLDSKSLENAIHLCRQKFGSLDIALNAAGIGENGPYSYLEPTGNWRACLRIDLEALMEATIIQVKEMRLNSSPGGVIVNIASMAGFIPIGMQPSYSAAKAGVIMFSRSLEYLSSEGIRVNCICPSYTVTPMVTSQGEDVMNMMKMQVGDLMTPEFVCEGIIELIEDKEKTNAIMRVTNQKGKEYVRQKVVPISSKL